MTYFDTIEPVLKRARWDVKFAVLPHRCVATDKLIWGHSAMRGVRVIDGPGTPVIEHYWMDPKEFTAWKLKM